MPLDDDVLRQGIDLHVLFLLRQPRPQLVSQRLQVSCDLAHGGEVQIAAALVVCVDGQVLVCRARNVVGGR